MLFNWSLGPLCCPPLFSKDIKSQDQSYEILWKTRLPCRAEKWNVKAKLLKPLSWSDNCLSVSGTWYHSQAAIKEAHPQISLPVFLSFHLFSLQVFQTLWLIPCENINALPVNYWLCDQQPNLALDETWNCFISLPPMACLHISALIKSVWKVSLWVSPDGNNIQLILYSVSDWIPFLFLYQAPF